MKKQKENIIEIKEEIQIEQGDKIITLEKGDKIKIFKEQNIPSNFSVTIEYEVRGDKVYPSIANEMEVENAFEGLMDLYEGDLNKIAEETGLDIDFVKDIMEPIFDKYNPNLY